MSEATKKTTFLVLLSGDAFSLPSSLTASIEPEVASGGGGAEVGRLMGRLPMHTEAIDARVLWMAPVTQDLELHHLEDAQIFPLEKREETWSLPADKQTSRVSVLTCVGRGHPRDVALQPLTLNSTITILQKLPNTLKKQRAEGRWL